MTNTNTPKQGENAPSEALSESKGDKNHSPSSTGEVGALLSITSGIDGPKHLSSEDANNHKNEGSAVLQVEITTTNNSNGLSSPLAIGPMFDEIEIERREQYQFNNFIR